MPNYRCVVGDSSAGTNLTELPLEGLTFSRQLSGCGQLSGSLDIWHASATETNLGANTNASDREITVFRDDVPVWNGPITGLDASVSSGAVAVTAREASWHLGKRTLEVNKNYDATDVFDAVRDLYTNMTTKTDGGSIIAALPRFAISPASADAGANISDSSPPTFYGSARHTILECLEALAADPTVGFEWRMDYKTGSTWQSVQRTLTLGYPNLGSTLTTQLTEAVLSDYGRTCDWEQAATRVHVLYSGGVKTLQSAAAVSDGILLSEVVADLSNVTKGSVATSYAKDLRRLSRPPVRAYTASFTPSVNGLAFDFCDLGDTVPLAISTPNILSIADTRRVIEIGVTPGDDGTETVALTFNIRLDDLNA